MKVLAAVVLSFIVIGLLLGYTWEPFLQWPFDPPDDSRQRNGFIWFMWSKSVDFGLLFLVAKLVKDKALKLSFYFLAGFFLVRVGWQVYAFLYSYEAASNKNVIKWMFFLITGVIGFLIIKGAWEHYLKERGKY